MTHVLLKSARRSTPIWFADRENWETVREALPKPAAAFADAMGFEPRAGRHLVLPAADGGLAGVLLGMEGVAARFVDPLAPGRLATILPAGDYAFANAPAGGLAALELATLGWALSAYRFTRYKSSPAKWPRLVVPAGVDMARVLRMAEGHALARDLVNTPANDMGPDALESAALGLARRHKAKVAVIRGADLLRKNFPLIHAVGRAAARPPRLVDLTWGPVKAPKVTLVGKGVCFDTGGLDLKPSSAMLLMKKDMAGAATALALAHMIMDAKLPVGRLILADALALADEEAPELLFDFATLTGAARVALGPDLPPFYTMDDALAGDIAARGMADADPVWRLPLWEPYDGLLDGKISTINNVSSGPFAGSITAALFLRRFVEKTSSWTHFDIYGWNPSTKPGRPEGGETQTARLLYGLIENRYKRA